MIATGKHVAFRGVHFAGGRVGRTLCLLALVAGCSHTREGVQSEWVASPAPESMIAVAPALNFSGTSTFDPVAVGDLMASELSDHPGIGVIGVSRVLAVLAEQGVNRIQSPEHALQVCERLGADSIVVFAITEYDAYTPAVGIAAQLYGPRPRGPELDPVTTSRLARPFAVPQRATGSLPWAQSQRVFNAAHEEVQEAVRRYADARSAGRSPYGWKKYLASQQWFLRFCCHAVIRDLMQQSGGLPLATPTVADATMQREVAR